MKYRRHLSQDCDPGPPGTGTPRKLSPPLQPSARPDPWPQRLQLRLPCQVPQMTCHLTLENPLNSRFCDAQTSCRHLSPLSPGAVTESFLSLHMSGAETRVTLRPRGDAPWETPSWSETPRASNASTWQLHF